MVLKRLIDKFWPHLIIFILSLLVAWPIFLPGYFSHHDDLQVMRVFEMRKCLEDFQIPCRWVPDLGFGNGYPLFNYYNSLPYYIGALASFTLGFIGGAKLLFLIAVILAGFSMYLLANRLFGLYPSLVAATLYIYAPYRALDIYVRGAIAESFSLAIIPLVFYFAIRASKENLVKNYIFLSLSLAAFLASHNIMTLLFSPLIVLFFIIMLWGKNWQVAKKTLFFISLGLGLSSFFILPAFLEKDLVQIDNLTRLELDFRAHFVTLPQLFLDRTWGYGASFPGVGDTISFQVGWPHWLIVILSIPSLVFLKRKNLRLFWLSLMMLLFFSFPLFMAHNRSAFIWEQIGILRFTQFPWRFLSVAIFTSSLLGAILIYNFKISWQKIMVIILVPVIILLNWSYFRPHQFYPNLTDQEKLSGVLWQTQQRASILDYLPVTAVEPREAAPSEPIIVSGQAEVNNFKNRSNRWEFKINVLSPTVVEMPVFDFPKWQVYVDGKKVDHSNKNYLGRISINLPSGNYKVVGKFENTPIRILGNLVTFVSIAIIIFLTYGKIGKISR